MPFIETLRGPVTLSIEARDQLLERIARLESGRAVVRAFGRAGLGDPVELDSDGKHLVVEALSLMLGEEETGGPDVDPQLRKLWEYLRDELADDG